MQDASYGRNCGAAPGNATKALALACDGRSTCSYTVDVDVLGDPAPGCPKEYVAHYVCTAPGYLRYLNVDPEAGWGSVIRLQCP